MDVSFTHNSTTSVVVRVGALIKYIRTSARNVDKLTRSTEETNFQVDGILANISIHLVKRIHQVFRDSRISFWRGNVKCLYTKLQYIHFATSTHEEFLCIGRKFFASTGEYSELRTSHLYNFYSFIFELESTVDSRYRLFE